MSSLGFHAVSNYAVPTKLVTLPSATSDAPVVLAKAPGSTKEVKISFAEKREAPAKKPRRKIVIKVKKPFSSSK